MSAWQAPRPDATHAGTMTGDSAAPAAGPSSSRPNPHHPSAAFRRVLSRGRRNQVGEPEGLRSLPARSAPVGPAPRLPSLIGAALAVGAVAGILELAVQAVQIQGLHHVDPSSLMINRHAGWMVVVTSSLLVPGLTLVLMAPALGWAAWRTRRQLPVHRLSWTWDLAGVILGTLLVLGPLQTIQGLHPAAPVSVALGLGVRLRRWLVWRSIAWQRISCWLGVMVIGLLPCYTLWQWHVVAGNAEHAWSRPAGGTSNLLWIVVDTLRADHMSVYGYDRDTTPQLETWAKMGITFNMARSAAAWTLPSHVTMFTGLWPTEHGARVERPYFGSSPTIAEHLRDRGYATAGIVANVRICNHAYGVGRGFDTYVDYPWNEEISVRAAIHNSALGGSVAKVARKLKLPVPGPYPSILRRPAHELADQGREWLDDVRRRNQSMDPGPDRRFFLLLNLMDVHGPYLPSASARRQFWTGPKPRRDQADAECGWVASHKLDAATALERPQRQQELEAVSGRLVDLYDECITGLDADLGRFLSDLRRPACWKTPGSPSRLIMGSTSASTVSSGMGPACTTS